MKITDLSIQRAKPRNKPYKIFDSGGLFLQVMPHGGKWWRFKYRFNNKEKLLSLGVYPDVSLKMARERRDQERRKIADKIDPSINRKAVKAAWENNLANSFEVVAREWIDKQSAVWSPANTEKITRRFELNIFTWLGERPVADILAPELLTHLRRMEKRGAVGIAHRVLQTCSQVFRYAIATGRAMRDPAADLRGALQPLPKEKHLSGAATGPPPTISRQ